VTRAAGVGGPAVRVAAAVEAVLVDVGLRGSGDADDMDPLTSGDWVLKVAADAEAAVGIEDVEADAVWAGWVSVLS
jgi:hypothetical protein